MLPNYEIWFHCDPSFLVLPKTETTCAEQFAFVFVASIRFQLKTGNQGNPDNSHSHV